MSKRRAILLDSFRTEFGKFDNLGQVLQVRTFGEQIVKRLCNSILVSTATSDQNEGSAQDSNKLVVKVAKNARSRIPLVVPTLEEDRRNNFSGAVGIHVGLNVISWAKIDRSRNVVQWDLFYLDADSKKVHPTSLLETVLEARMEIPDSDVYVMEDASAPGQTTQQQVTSLSIQLRKSQLSAMLLVLLNTTNKFLDNDSNPTDPKSPESCQRVFYLRSRSTARLFRTLVGSECVSAQTVVREILEPSRQPTDYSPVVIDNGLKSYYVSKDNVEREYMCQSLLLTMTFMDLLIFENPRSIKIVTGR